MKLESFAASAKKLLPLPVFSVVRSAGTAFLTPILFSLRTGHWKSSFRKKAVDSHGRPLPWYTYPAIHFLLQKDFKGRRILEWGAGQSTLWWASKAKEVVSFEADKKWHDEVKTALPPNAVIHLTREDLSDFEKNCPAGLFDVIVIDGLDREKCAAPSIELLAPDGAVLLDNADGFWGKEGSFPILDRFSQAGFQRIDFIGYAPGVVRPHCTSVFFKSTCFLFSGTDRPRVDFDAR